MNSRLPFFKSILVFICCVFISSAAVAQSGNNQNIPDAQKEQGQQVTPPSSSDPASLSDQVKGQSNSSQVNKGTTSNDDPGITNPPASYYDNLEDRVNTIEQKINGLDPQSEEYKNLDRKLKSIKEILENR